MENADKCAAAAAAADGGGDVTANRAVCAVLYQIPWKGEYNCFLCDASHSSYKTFAKLKKSYGLFAGQQRGARAKDFPLQSYHFLFTNFFQSF